MNKFEGMDQKARVTPQDSKAELFSIGDLAQEFCITTRAIRFYEDKGLISPGRVSGVRAYDRRDRARLILILRGKRLGFSLEDIAEYLSLYDTDPSHVTQLKHLEKQVDEAIARLEQQRADIELTIDELQEIREKTITALADRAD